ncbi:hypothetical protein NPIL_167911 [Nephila pilipes]|uniref:Uncharacterized protein n=1 Tax=Nephila pilipes TaxID=299642 RepID=A0A8X6PP85_NEPPI|nr:hypothetical protein NPIL_167911 [Nephila pilipes]
MMRIGCESEVFVREILIFLLYKLSRHLDYSTARHIRKNWKIMTTHTPANMYHIPHNNAENTPCVSNYKTGQLRNLCDTVTDVGQFNCETRSSKLSFKKSASKKLNSLISSKNESKRCNDFIYYSNNNKYPMESENKLLTSIKASNSYNPRSSRIRNASQSKCNVLFVLKLSMYLIWTSVVAAVLIYLIFRYTRTDGYFNILSSPEDYIPLIFITVILITGFIAICVALKRKKAHVLSYNSSKLSKIEISSNSISPFHIRIQETQV